MCVFLECGGGHQEGNKPTHEGDDKQSPIDKKTLGAYSRLGTLLWKATLETVCFWSVEEDIRKATGARVT